MSRSIWSRSATRGSTTHSSTTHSSTPSGGSDNGVGSVAQLRVASTIPVSVVDGPGCRTTIFLQGCNLDCFNCHNAALIASDVGGTLRSVDSLLAELRPRAAFLTGITVSGGEATHQLDGLSALLTAVKADPGLRHLTTLIDSNGTLEPEGWCRLAPVMDGAMIDVKAVGLEEHRRITGSDNAAVLRSVAALHALDRLVEVRLLVLEGLTDTEVELRRYAAFIGGIDPDIEVRLLAYRHHGVRAAGRAWPETSAETMQRVAARLEALGLTRVRVPKVR